MTLDEALDRLFEVPLGEFTAARNRLAKELDHQGDREAAASIKALKKPPVSVWAVNQLARRLPDEVEELVASHERLAEAGDARSMRSIQEQRKRLISRLDSAAASILEEAGHSAASATIQRVSQTLLAASSGDELEALRRGRLTDDLEPSGFGAMAGFELAGDSKPFQKDDGKARAKAEDLSLRAQDAAREAADARKLADEAAAEAARLQALAERAEKRAERALAAAEEALEGLR